MSCQECERLRGIGYRNLELAQSLQMRLKDEHRRAERAEELLRKADELYTNYGLVARHEDCGPWINNVREFLDKPETPK